MDMDKWVNMPDVDIEVLYEQWFDYIILNHFNFKNDIVFIMYFRMSENLFQIFWEG